ncbi:MAG TPA: lytic murein transglycosylase [Solirubrobacteraceae bacterium]|nr:lytic murein transglycosylase [Solirubrobacteraceae bacterium]
MLTLALCALAWPGVTLAAGGGKATPAPAPSTGEPPAVATTPSSEATPAPAPSATTTTTTTTPSAPPAAAEAAPAIATEVAQGATGGSARSRHAGRSRPRSGETTVDQEASQQAQPAQPRATHKALAPSALTPSLPLALQGSIGGVPSFFIEDFDIPPFLLPIFQAAGAAYDIPWQVLAAINEVETDYGRDLSVSSAGAEGWMQFLPSEWAQYGVDATGDGWEDPYNPADAIFAAARYLRAAGGERNIKAAVYAYNHSQAYVEAVMLRSQLLDGTPPELLGAITGLTEARFPVYAPAHYSDGFQTTTTGEPLAGTTIYSQEGAPVIAVQDGEVTEIGESPSLGHYVELRDAYGNTYVYAQLGEVASVYPVLEPRVNSAVSPRLTGASKHKEPTPDGPATAGAQPRSPLSEAATISALALGAAASLEGPPSSTTPSPPAVQPPKPPTPPAHLRSFSEGSDEVYLHPLEPGAQVIAGTVLGHVGADATTAQTDGVAQAPHIFFQIRPAGPGGPLIDPKPILDGWVALEDTSIFRAKGENPFLATSPTVGQVLLESQQQLAPQVLHAASPQGDGGIGMGRCARDDVQEGRVDKRVLAMLEYLSVSGLRPSVAGLPCPPVASGAGVANPSAGDTSDAVNIVAINGIPVAGHQGPGSIAEQTVRKLLMLQGISRPQRIVSLEAVPGAAASVASPHASKGIHVAFGAPVGAGAHTAALAAGGLSPSQWIELIDRLGEIPDPTVASGHSSAAIADPGTSSAAETQAAPQGEAGGDD